MSVLSSVKPPMWPLSPELTEAPDLWRQHILTVFGWELSGAPREYPFTPPISNNIKWKYNRYGATLIAEGLTSPLVSYPTKINSISKPFTILFIISYSTVNNTIIFDGADNDFSIQTSSTASTDYEGGSIIFRNNSSVSDPEFGTSKNYGDGVPHTFVLRARTDGEMNIFVDGLEDTLKISSLPTGPTTIDGWELFSRNGSAGFPGDMSLFHMINVDLGYGRTKKLSADPFAVLRPNSEIF